MLTSELQLFNAALNAAGTRSKLVSTDEKSIEAETCRLWYPIVRDQVLASAPWATAKKVARLPLIRARADNTDWQELDPSPGNKFVFGAPSDMVAPRYLAGWSRFEVGIVGSQKVIETSTENAVLTYTYRNASPAIWSAGLQMAMVYALAAHITMPLQGKPQRAQGAIQQANALITSARNDEANYGDSVVESIPEWIVMRGYAPPSESTRYVYPLGQLFSLGAAGV